MNTADFHQTMDRHWMDRSGPWTRWADRLSDMADRFNRPMIEGLKIHPGERILDLASGAGEPALSLARAVGAEGQVVATDPISEMLETIRRRSEAEGLRHLKTRRCHAESLPFGDGSFDAVTCRFGIMFFADIETSLLEVRRVLRSGGRCGFLVWGPVADNPLQQAVRSTLEHHLGADPTLGGAAIGDRTFAHSEPGRISEELMAAEFDEVLETSFHFNPSIPRDRPFWRPALEMAGGARLETLADADRARIDEHVRQSLAPLLEGDAYRLRTHIRLGTGRKR